MLTAQYLKSILMYDPLIGHFTWVNCGSYRINPGTRAGSKNGKGYIQICIHSKLYTAHRLAWLYTYGYFPAAWLDHINGNKSDNSIANLREATNAENQKNAKKRITNTSGFTGVSRSYKRWRATASHNGKSFNLGCFDTPEEASVAYKTFASKHHGIFAHNY